MEASSRGDLATHEWQKAEGQRARAITEENVQRDDRLDALEAAVQDLRAGQELLLEVYRGLAKKL